MGLGRLAPARSTRSRLLWAAGVLAVLVATAAVVLSQSGEDESEGLEVTLGNGERWRIDIAADPERAAPGAGVAVRMTVENTSDAATQGLAFSSTRQFTLVARDERGRVAWRVADPARRLALTRGVAPGSVVTYERVWRTPRDRAGRYSIEGRVLDSDLQGRSTVRTSVVLE